MWEPLQNKEAEGWVSNWIWIWEGDVESKKEVEKVTLISALREFLNFAGRLSLLTFTREALQGP